MEENNKVFSGLIWRFLERFGAQIVSFIISIVLARLLDPNVYGVIAIVTVFITILQVFVDSGLGTALIQKRDADDLDFSTVFYANIVLCVLLYTVLFFFAPLIAKLYAIPELTLIIRVMGIAILISALKNIQQAYVSRKMMFKKFFFATLGGTIGAAIVGISLAVSGFGVWALVAQNLFNLTTDTIILWVTVKWRPKKMFSFKRFKKLFSYGVHILTAALIDTIYKNLRSLIIGKVYSTEDLAYYSKGQKFPELAIINVNASIDSVLLPSMSNENAKIEKVRSMTRRSIKLTTYIIFPIMVGLAVCAEPLVLIFLTAKWLPAVFYIKIFCFTFALYPIHTANLNAIKALGKSRTYLVLEIIKKVVGLSLLFSTMWISVKAMAYSLLLMSIISQFINAFPNKKLLNYSFKDQASDIFPNVFIALLMGFAVFCLGRANLNSYILLPILVITGVVLYILLSKLLQNENLEYATNLIKGIFTKKHANKK